MERSPAIEILPVHGAYPGMPVTRGYEIRLVSTLPPDSVRSNRGTIGWSYDGSTLRAVLTVPPGPVNKRVEVVVRGAAAPATRHWAGDVGA